MTKSSERFRLKTFSAVGEFKMAPEKANGVGSTYDRSWQTKKNFTIKNPYKVLKMTLLTLIASKACFIYALKLQDMYDVFKLVLYVLFWKNRRCWNLAGGEKKRARTKFHRKID